MTEPARAYATVTGPTAIYTDPTGRRTPLEAPAGEDIRHTIMRRAIDDARSATLHLHTTGDRGEHDLLIDTDGTITPTTPPRTLTLLPDPPTADLPPQPPAMNGPDGLLEPEPPQANHSEAQDARRRGSFITSEQATAQRLTGWRAALASLGITVRPSAAQQQRAERIGAVSRHWAGCRSIAVANGKGGVGKTLTTAMLSAVFAREGGGSVLAWDNNDTRGTLGWRTEQSLYDTTIRDLLPAVHHLLESSSGISDISQYVHHQGADRYDVLRSNPELLAVHQRLTTADFELLARVAARHYRIVIFDSGNDESADRWLSMIDHAHQLVIPTLTAPESAESARLLLDALRERDAHSARLADSAVVVVTQSEPAGRPDMERIARGFKDLVPTVVRVPFDPSLKAGPLRFDQLRPRTKDAWLEVAAATAATFDTPVVRHE
jgi:MinD-like ATPase involved in chromosome partitioning or flagellar assembly